MKICSLYSGGKDSTYALYWAQQQGYPISCVLTMRSKANDSYMFHIPNIHLTEESSQALGIPLVTGYTEGKKEEELKDLERMLKEVKEKFGVEGVTTGALASNYQAERILAICKKLNLQCFNPIWQKDQYQYLKELLKLKFKIMIVGAAAHGIDEHWLGRVLDEKAVEDLKKLNEKYGSSIGGEGGEYESLVLDCPAFKKALKILDAEKHWEGSRGEFIIKKVELVKK